MKTIILGVSMFLAMTQFAFSEDAPPAGPIQVTVKSDKQEYTHGEPGVVYVMPPTGKLKATLTVKNVSGKVQKLEFRSGQKYDFVIRDAKGKELVRWSKDKGFIASIEEIELEPGNQLTYNDEVLLGDIAKPLPEGDYTLEGILTSHPSISARVAFKIVPTPAKAR